VRERDRHPAPRPLAIALDRDRIVDQAEACPVRAPQDDAGCSLPHDLVVTGDRIILDERVLFDDNRARVKHRAWPVLESIVAAWHGRPDWRAIRIEGHADARGPDDYNAWLSEERARRVRDKLIELGMPAAALSIEGYGESRPRADGTSPDAYQRNRRVEFVITTGPPRTGPVEEE
jgi:outer membrane protein OmpA-like peptidoglycan-associated protein